MLICCTILCGQRCSLHLRHLHLSFKTVRMSHHSGTESDKHIPLHTVHWGKSRWAVNNVWKAFAFTFYRTVFISFLHLQEWRINRAPPSALLPVKAEYVTSSGDRNARPIAPHMGARSITHTKFVKVLAHSCHKRRSAMLFMVIVK